MSLTPRTAGSPPAFVSAGVALPRTGARLSLAGRPVGHDSACALSARRGAPVRPAHARAPTMGLRDRLARSLGAAAVAALLAVSSADAALAARSGARMGGSSFRSPVPAQQYSAPAAGGAGVGVMGGGYGYGYGGGGYFGPTIMPMPMLVPVGGGFATVLVAGTVAALAYRAIAERQEDKMFEQQVNPETALVTLKIGLLSSARQLQIDLDNVARSADTSSVQGLRYVLEESVLSLLRNPDRWMYASIGTDVKPLDEAEDAFNRACMQGRLKITEETLTNVGGNRREMPKASSTTGDLLAPPAEYIVVSLVLAATERDLMRELPKEINAAADVNRALGVLGGVSSESLQAIEVIWAPQSLTDTLTEKEMLLDHPELRQI